jgi:hypothetical protein
MASVCEFIRFHAILELLRRPQAYHDSATHNIIDGTGGLDGSIFYELDRAEVGNAWTSLSVG